MDEPRTLPDLTRGPPINAAEWQRVKSILAQALELPPAERERFVASVCVGDVALQQEIEELLSFQNRADYLLTDDEIEESSEGRSGYELPECVGPYRILREIGHGGMGVVCLGKRDDGAYDRVVAVKLIGNSVQRDKFAKLFRRERQILAQLDHPNIARLLDGGTSQSGQPYYAMEYVEGEPVDKYCQLHELTIRERLELFLSICSAVSYAHRNLIIHRDLKPTNVLVTGDGIPKLLDFGVARMLAQETDTQRTTGIPLTPFYASPEQITGDPLSVATDIYSLGVLLYELLSGRHPYEAGQGANAAFRTMLEDAPIPLRQQAPGIPGDLANVVMKAIRKEPERRYPTVDAFAQDIRDFLDGFPVRAAADTLAYRLNKFVRRNRWAVIAVSIAVAGIAISGVFIWREKQQAEMRFQQVRQLAHSVVFELHDAIQDLPGSSRASELLIARGLEYLNALAKTRGNDPSLNLELAQAYMKIGAAQGDLEQANIGDPNGALASYNKARGLLLGLYSRSPANRDVERSLALVDNDIAVLAPYAHPALDLRAESIKLFKDLARTSPGPSGLRDRALAHFYLAFSQTEEHKFSAALPIWNQALAEYSEIEQQESHSSDAKRNVALVEKRFASAYYGLGNYAAAVRHDRNAIRIDQARVTTEPENPTALMDLSFDLVELSSCLYELKNNEEAAEALDHAIALRRQVADADPHDFRAQSQLETVLRMAGTLRSESDSLNDAWPLEREAAAIGAGLHARDGRNVAETVSLALDYFELGETNRRIALGDRRNDAQYWRAALTNFRNSENLAERIPAAAYDSPDDRDKLAKIPGKIAECLQHGG